VSWGVERSNGVSFREADLRWREIGGRDGGGGGSESVASSLSILLRAATAWSPAGIGSLLGGAREEAGGMFAIVLLCKRKRQRMGSIAKDMEYVSLALL